jgi:hypothetical protein
MVVTVRLVLSAWVAATSSIGTLTVAADSVSTPDAMRVPFAAVDADHDGAISRLEAHRLPRLEEEFPLVDGNADGWVSRDEFEAFSPTPQTSNEGS